MKKFVATAATGLVLGIMVFAGTLSRVTADTPTPSPAPQVSSDLVLVVNDSYTSPEAATISLRNDGQVPYTYNPAQPQCSLKYAVAGGGREFRIPSAVHCDLPGQTAELAPGQTVQVTQWSLDECTLPGFSCFAVRPLPSGDYTISGSLNSVDGTKRAEFSKSISITGPSFTNDITASFGVIVTDPPAGVPPVFLTLFNNGSVAYAMPQGQCVLFFKKPDGIIFSIPVTVACGSSPALLAPGGRLDIVTNWRLDECTQFGPGGSCLTSQPLAPGTYTVEGAAWSQDRQSYAEFSAAYKVSAAPSPTAKLLPDLGGPPGDAGPPMGTAAALAFGVLFTVLGGFAISRRSS